VRSRFRVSAVVAAVGLIALSAPQALASPTAGPCPPGYYVSPDDLTMCLPPTPGNTFVSIAASTTTGLAGWGSAHSMEEADRIAIAQCTANTNSVCSVVANASNGCVAYAVDAATRTIGGGAGPDPSSAAANALFGLANGEILTVRCSRP
jgi:hypothetical protein